MKPTISISKQFITYTFAVAFVLCSYSCSKKEDTVTPVEVEEVDDTTNDSTDTTDDSTSTTDDTTDDSTDTTDDTTDDSTDTTDDGTSTTDDTTEDSTDTTDDSTSTTDDTTDDSTDTEEDENKDTDADGVPDAIEVLQQTDSTDATSFKDSDNGGIADYIEEQSQLDTTNPYDDYDATKAVVFEVTNQWAEVVAKSTIQPKIIEEKEYVAKVVADQPLDLSLITIAGQEVGFIHFIEQGGQTVIDLSYTGTTPPTGDALLTTQNAGQITTVFSLK